MISVLTFGGVAAAACGYKYYKTVVASDPDAERNRQKQIALFRERHAENIPPPREGGVASPPPLTVSFDLFDTLVGRAVSNPDVIFDLVESRSGVVGFAKARRLSATLVGLEDGIDEVYARLELPATVDVKALQALEWQIELENAVLIQSNVRKLEAVTPGTQIIIVSDTFYRAEKLRELLVHVAMPRLGETVIFASRSGKSDGWIWPILAESYSIISHTGDNFASDVKSALHSRMVSGAHHSRMAHIETQGEALLFKFANHAVGSPEFAFGAMMRRLTLRNPYDFITQRQKFVWYRIHASFTIPLFYFFVRSIEDHLRSHPTITRLVLVNRDCIMLKPFIDRLLLQDRGMLSAKGEEGERAVTVASLDASRKLLRDQLVTPNEDYLAYLRETLGGDSMASTSLVLDINGTYKSLSDVCAKYQPGIPRAHYLSQQVTRPNPLTKGIFTSSIQGIDTNIIEHVNVSLAGSTIGWSENRSVPFGGPLKVPCEYDDAFIEVTRAAVEDAVSHVLQLREPVVLPKQRIMEALLQKATVTLRGKMLHHDYHPTLLSLLPDTNNPEIVREKELANCYARILSRFAERPWINPVSLLDIVTPKPEGVNRTSKKKSTMPWEDYMHKRISVTTLLNLDNLPAVGTHEVVVVTASDTTEAVSLIPSLWEKTGSILAVHVTHSSLDRGKTICDSLLDSAVRVSSKWNLVEGLGILPGALLVFERVGLE